MDDEAKQAAADKALNELKSIALDHDIEYGHVRADDILCELLCALGYGDIVAAYAALPKWYA